MSRSSALLSVFLAFAAAAFAQAPLNINGIADKANYLDAVSFWVPSTPGYSQAVFLDGSRAPADVTNLVNNMDYHEVSVWRTNMSTLEVSNRVVRFVIVSSNRNGADRPEFGLMQWTPYPTIPSTAGEFAGAQMRLIVPQDFPMGIEIPVIARVEDGEGYERRANGSIIAPGFESAPVKIRRGVGCGYIPPATNAGTLVYAAQLHGMSAPKQVNIEPSTTWTIVSGVITGAVEWPANSRIRLASSILVTNGAVLTIGAGTVVRVDPLINITNTGRIVINGTADQPVVFTSTNHIVPEDAGGAWGGFVMRTNTSELVANYAIFTGAGGANSWTFSPASSHKSQQPVLFLQFGAQAWLTNCAVIHSHGQVGSGYRSRLTIDHTLFQRGITCGEWDTCTNVFNHSALIEFPEENGQVDAIINNADYDAIYFIRGTNFFTNTLVGFSKDDAIDAGSDGSGDPLGTVRVEHGWLESALHECLAWSGHNRRTWAFNTVTMNSGQGIENGWTDGSRNYASTAVTPDCYAENLLSTANSVGARVGDNYNWGYRGFLRLTNSLVLFNYRDAFLKTWNDVGISWDTNSWVDRLGQIAFDNSELTTADPRFPATPAWNPAADGIKLTNWMTAPADSPVGAGFAVWTNLFPMTSIFAGIPVRLSLFTTHPVSVDYEFVGNSGTLASGTLSFVAGETLKRVYPGDFNLQGQSSVQVRLRTANGGEVTGISNVLFTGTVPSPVASAAVLGTQIGMERIAEGVPVRLSAPAAHTVSIGYSFMASTGTLASGTLIFAPGSTLAWATVAAGTNEFDVIRFDLTSGTGAPIAGATNIYFVRGDMALQFAPVDLVAAGSRWKYLDDGSNQGTGWRVPSFNDTAWASGPAQLGFGDGDEATVIKRTNTVTGATNITFYFRSRFVVTNTAAYTNLSMWLLRDDGGVVYINNNEVFRTPNMPTGTISYNTLASSTGENTVDTATLNVTNLVAGTNVVAVEIHQQALSSSDVSFDFELIGNPLQPPAPAQHLVFGSFGGDLTLGWGDNTFLLEQSDTVTGIWTQVTSPSPFTTSPTNAQKFYRLRR